MKLTYGAFAIAAAAALGGGAFIAHAVTPPPAAVAKFAAEVTLEPRFAAMVNNQKPVARIIFNGQSTSSTPFTATLAFEGFATIWQYVDTIQILRTCPSGAPGAGRHLKLAQWDVSEVAPPPPSGTTGSTRGTSSQSQVPQLLLNAALLSLGSCNPNLGAPAVVQTIPQAMALLNTEDWRIEFTYDINAIAPVTTGGTTGQGGMVGPGGGASSTTALPGGTPLMGKGIIKKDTNTTLPTQPGLPRRPCHSYQSPNGSTIPQGYGSPFRVFRDNTRLLDVYCADDRRQDGKYGVKVRAGTGDQNDLVYRYGYIFRKGDSGWTRFDFSASTSPEAGNWYRGAAEAQTDHVQTQVGEDNYVLAYVCSWDGGRWKCGCQDSQCAAGKWQIMKFRNEPTQAAPPPAPATQ